MNGGTIQSAVGGWTVPTDWVVQAVGDLNGDGKADVLWRQTSTGITSAWLLNGGTIQSAVGGWTVPTDWVVRGVGDFDGDGKADILWRQASTGVGTIWLMNGGTVQSAVGGWSVPTDWTVQLVSDFNGDGKSDIVWRQTGTGITSVWLMNGGTIQSAVGGWNVAVDWGVQTPGPTGLTLAWQDNSGGAESGFKIERSPDGSTNWTEIGSTGANVAIYQDAGLAPSTTYYYRVRAYNGTTNSTYSNSTSGTTP
jgi:hypothetical protein